jgi:peptidase E
MDTCGFDKAIAVQHKKSARMTTQIQFLGSNLCGWRMLYHYGKAISAISIEGAKGGRVSLLEVASLRQSDQAKCCKSIAF